MISVPTEKGDLNEYEHHAAGSDSMSKSPCETCVIVRDPKNCENKLCQSWQQWFIDRWEALRRQYRQEAEIEHFTVGGFRYYHPNAIRRFLEKEAADGLGKNGEAQTEEL